LAGKIRTDEYSCSSCPVGTRARRQICTYASHVRTVIQLSYSSPGLNHRALCYVYLSSVDRDINQKNAHISVVSISTVDSGVELVATDRAMASVRGLGVPVVAGRSHVSISRAQHQLGLASLAAHYHLLNTVCNCHWTASCKQYTTNI
jgi:hypothetical protein